jgi:hypothetical protein
MFRLAHQASSLKKTALHSSSASQSNALQQRINHPKNRHPSRNLPTLAAFAPRHNQRLASAFAARLDFQKQTVHLSPFALDYPPARDKN